MSHKCPEDVLKTSLYGSISKAKKRPRDRTSVFGLSIKKCYITKMASSAQHVDHMKRRDINYVLNWITRRISFIKKFVKFYLYFINVINSFNQNCLILQQNWLYITRKNPCHQQWQENNVNLACFIAITIFPFWITESEEYYMKNRIFDESIFDINVLKLLSL